MIGSKLKNVHRDVLFVSRVLRNLLQFRRVERQKLNVGKIFDEYANRHPGKVCFYFEDEQWSYKRVQDTSNKIANYFAGEGFRRQDAVSLFMENRPQYVCTWLGLSRVGIIPALINTNLRSVSLKHSIQVAKSKAIVYGNELESAIEDLYTKNGMTLPLYESGVPGPGNTKTGSSKNIDLELNKVSKETPKGHEDINMHDELFYIYTSGTTGLPKAAVIKHARFYTFALGAHIMGSIGENDILYNSLPLYHSSGGLLGIGQAVLFGTPVIIKTKFSASNFWKDCVKYNATCAQYICETCRYLLRSETVPEEKFHKVKMMIGNGLRPEIWSDFVNRFNIPNIVEFYGSSEGNANLVNNTNKPGPTGFIPHIFRGIFPVTNVKLDGAGEPIRDKKSGLLVKCKPGESGELIAKIVKNHPFRDFKGYASDTGANKNKVIADAFEKGDFAFRSGDIFVKDKEGFYYFKDRMGDTFRWKGENVSTTEVEYIISNLIGLKDVVVYGVKIPGTDGQAGMVALADECNSFDVDKFKEQIEKSLPPYARPLFLRIVQQIEMTGTHKMKKTDLQNQGIQLGSNSKDRIYFLLATKCELVDETLCNKIISGEIKL